MLQKFMKGINLLFDKISCFNEVLPPSEAELKNESVER